MICPILIDKFVCNIVMGAIRLNHIFIKLNGKCGLRTTLVGKYLFQYRFEWYDNLRRKLQWKEKNVTSILWNEHFKRVTNFEEKLVDSY